MFFKAEVRIKSNTEAFKSRRRVPVTFMEEYLYRGQQITASKHCDSYL